MSKSMSKIGNHEEDNMNATRRLDVLAAIGGVLVAVVIALSVYLVNTNKPALSAHGWEDVRKAVLQNMPASEIRADFEVLSAWNPYLDQEAYNNRKAILDKAVQDYPNSARLLFRLGSIAEGQASVDALKKASNLDPKNALTLYLLASEAASQKTFDKALALLKQGNSLESCTAYPLPADIGGKGLSQEEVVMESSMSQADLGTSARLRQSARYMADTANALHAGGRSDEALSILRETKLMAKKTAQMEPRMMMSVLVGVSITNIALKQEEQIYRETGSKTGLTEIAKEKSELQYIKAGARAYNDQSMKNLVRRTAKISVPAVLVSALPLQMMVMLFILLVWAGLAPKAGPASANHPEAADQAFPMGKLFMLYVLVFLPIGIIATALVYLLSASKLVGLNGAIAFIAAWVPTILLHWKAVSSYKKALRQQASDQEKPKFWIGAPHQEKREVIRRLAGVHGGAMVFLVLWGILASCGGKLVTGSFPWQFDRLMSEPLQWEQRYVTDLLDHKIKVPEKYIREQEQTDARRSSPAQAR